MAETDNFIPEKFSSSSSPALIWALQRWWWWEYYLCPVHIKSNHRKKGGCGLWMERRSLKLFYCTAFLYWPALGSSLNWRFILFLSGLMVGWGKFPHCHCIVFYINIYWTSARKIFQMVRTPYLLLLLNRLFSLQLMLCFTSQRSSPPLLILERGESGECPVSAPHHVSVIRQCRINGRFKTYLENKMNVINLGGRGAIK